ncbi:MAG: 60S ribosomal export protein NMD3 [archaeon]|nr:MAG: 60S ribosomal export protein NMD3 [archaeon]
MKQKFCPACGKEKDSLFGGLCESCFKKKRLAKLPDKIKVRICKNCGKVGGKRAKNLDREVIKKLVKDNLKVDGSLNKIEITRMEGIKNLRVEVKVYGLLGNGIEKTETLETQIVIREILCQTCGKVKGGYYEAVIQLRSFEEEVLTKALKSLEEAINRRGRVTKIEKRKNGFDIYFTPKKIINRVLKILPETKELKRSYTLVTKKEGKDLYRNTVLVRL